MKKNSKKSSRKSTTSRNRINLNLKIVKKVSENPRRKGTHGFKSMEIILGSRKPMAVETFVEKGGRLRDLHWDVNAGHVALKKVS